MSNTDKYNLLYQAVKKQEEINECPLYFPCGVWLNTDGNGWIDIEAPRGAIVTNDYDEIIELLSDNNIELSFNDNNDPIMRAK